MKAQLEPVSEKEKWRERVRQENVKKLNLRIGRTCHCLLLARLILLNPSHSVMLVCGRNSTLPSGGSSNYETLVTNFKDWAHEIPIRNLLGLNYWDNKEGVTQNLLQFYNHCFRSNIPTGGEARY